ncbi:MAG: hypothetical protein WBB28_03770 [Crinalium sp.]
MAKTLAELKKQADLLELEAYQIRGFGKLTSIQTWEDAKRSATTSRSHITMKSCGKIVSFKQSLLV